MVDSAIQNGVDFVLKIFIFAINLNALCPFCYRLINSITNHFIIFFYYESQLHLDLVVL